MNVSRIINNYINLIGSGKTTYCHKMMEFYKDIDRPVAVVNLDPANEQMSYKASIDIVRL